MTQSLVEELRTATHDLGTGSPPVDWSLLVEAQAELDSYKVALNQHAIVGVTDRAGTIISVNDRFCRISKYSRAELLGKKHNLLNSRYHPREFFRSMWRTISSGQPWHGDICNRAKDGSLYWVDTTIVPRRAVDGKICGYVSIRYDVTKRKAAEAAQAEEIRKRETAEILLRDIIEALPNGVAAFDAQDRLTIFNSAYREFYDLMGPAIVEGAGFENILHHGVERGQFILPKETEASKQAWFDARMHDHRNPGRRLIQHLSGGRWLQVQERLSRTGYTVGVRTDITELKLAERQIKRQAERDPLTGLYNRRVVLDRLGRLLNAERQPPRLGALVLVDLDGFKNVNDTLGHDAGDALLVEIAERFRQAVRKTDMVARLGGDEFALIFPSLTSEEDAARIVEKLLRCLSPAVTVGTRTVVATASFGVALIPRHGRSATDLMKHADMALYEAKGSGRCTYAVYRPQLQRIVERRAAMTTALRRAMARDQIQVALQPQVSLASGRHVGFEALVRWRRGRTAVPAPEIIAAAEQAGLVVPLGYHIIDKALATMRGVLDAGMEPGRLALNLAADQLKEPGFADKMCGLIACHRMIPGQVEIEITENVVLDRSATTIVSTLRELHAAGMAIALDDFGTGFASLAHLKRFPLSRLKIDRSFVAGVNANGDDTAIARAILSLAHSLGMEVVAEGVETEEQYRTLSNFGCDLAQGHLISMPLLGEDIYDYMNKQANFAMI